MKNWKKIVSLLSTWVLLATGLKTVGAKGEGFLDSIELPPSLQNLQYDPNNKAYDIFGWVDDGRLFNLSEGIAHLRLEVDFAIKSFLTTVEPVELTFFNLDTEIHETVRGGIFSDFYTGEEICRVSNDRRYFDFSKEYFKYGERVEYYSSLDLMIYIEYRENYEELKSRMKNNQTIEEVVETMLLMKDNWYTQVKKEHVFSGNVPMTRAGELIPAGNVYYKKIKVNDKVVFVFSDIYKDSKNKIIERELFTSIDISDVNKKKINPVFVKALGLKKLKGNDIATCLMSSLGIRDLAGPLELQRYVRDALVKIDNRAYYDVGKLALVYDMIPDEFKFDFSKLPELSSTIERRNIGYDMLKDENASAKYVIRSAPENFYNVPRMGKNNPESIPERRNIYLEESPKEKVIRMKRS